jgi:acetylglutamate kinase
MSIETPVVIKIGGAALQDKNLVADIAKDIAQLRERYKKIVLVHGGGPLINEELKRQGITWEFFEGQRITTAPMMSVIESVLSGAVNRSIVHELNRRGARAVGFSGVDGPTLHCKKADARLEMVGIVEKVDLSLINACLKNSLIPVIAPIGWHEGETLNVNADWAATSIATALQAARLIFLTDQDGVLDGNKVVQHDLNRASMQTLIDKKIIQGGMLAKARTIFHALDRGIQDVVIANARTPGILFHTAESSRTHGTWCRN